MQKIEQNKEKKRQAILQAAQDIFLSEGYVLTSMDNIAKRAQVTKQTVYRYYPSKIVLFKATLEHIGQSEEFDFLVHLENPNTKEALYKFAYGFIQVHLSAEHLATFKLLVSESGKAPEIVHSFCAVGMDEVNGKLSEFFIKRLGVKEAEISMQLWTAMLLAQRESVLIGMKKPSDQEIQAYAKKATDFLLAAIA